MERRLAAVDYYIAHGGFIGRKVRALGYPSRRLLKHSIYPHERTVSAVSNISRRARGN